MKLTRGWIIGIVAAVVVIAAVIAGLVLSNRGAQQAEGAARSAVVERGSMLVTVSASGRVEPRSRAGLAFEAPGRVTEVLVEIGDEVSAGDVLVTQDLAPLALQVAEAEAALASAAAQLAQLQEGARPEEVAMAEASAQAAQSQLSAADATRDGVEAGPSAAELARAEADLASAQAQQRVAEDFHDLTMTCWEFEYMGEQHKICPILGTPEEQARYRLQAADEGLRASQAYMDELADGADETQLQTAQADVWAAAARRDAAQAQLDLVLAGADEPELAVARAGVDQARAGLAQAQLALEQASLRAPFDGVVGTVAVEPNDVVPAGQPVVTVLDPTAFQVALSVDEIDVGRVAVGQAVEVGVDALPDVVLSGVVERIAPAATYIEGVVYYDVVIGLDPTGEAIRADMTANATIIVQELSDVLFLPTWVVRVDRDSGQTYVDRPAGRDTERVDIETGVRYGGFVQIVEGLAEGDEVVWVDDDEFGHP